MQQRFDGIGYRRCTLGFMPNFRKRDFPFLRRKKAFLGCKGLDRLHGIVQFLETAQRIFRAFGFRWILKYSNDLDRADLLQSFQQTLFIRLHRSKAQAFHGNDHRCLILSFRYRTASSIRSAACFCTETISSRTSSRIFSAI